jgi:hypothetical protein
MTICTPGKPKDVHLRKPWSEVQIHADAAADPQNMDELYITLGKCTLHFESNDSLKIVSLCTPYMNQEEEEDASRERRKRVLV